MRDSRQIFDGPDKFPKSCVHYVRFHDYPLRYLFARCREREEIYQKDQSRWKEQKEWDRYTEVTLRLRELEEMLIFMVSNAYRRCVDDSADLSRDLRKRKYYG